MTASFALFAPGLMDSIRGARDSGLEIPRLSSVETCLTRGQRGDAEHGLYDALEAFIVEHGGAATLPSEAPSSYLGDMGEAPDGWCCRADPVHLQPVGDHLRLLDDSVLKVKLEEAQSLVAAFNATYQQEGMTLVCGAPARWYLTSDGALDVGRDSPDKVHGHSVLDYLNEGPSGAAGRQLMNEIQMIFHGHGVNKEREDNSRPAINSVWLWGGGSLPTGRSLDLPLAWGDQACLRGLWSWAGTAVMPLPEGAEPCLSRLDDRSGLAVMEDFLTPLRASDASTWSGALQRFDASWCQPAMKALRSGRVGEVRLISDGIGVRMTKSSLRRWWRRSRPLGSYAGL